MSPETEPPEPPERSSPPGPEESSARAFLLRLVHDLRSPLNASLMWLDVLQLKEQSAETRKAIDAIRRGIDRQARVLRDLGDAAAYAAGPIDLATRRIGVETLMRHIAAAAAALGPESHPAIGIADAHHTDVDVDVDCVARAVALIVAHLAGAGPLVDGSVRVQASVIGDSRLRISITREDAVVDPRTLRALLQVPWRRPQDAHGATGLGLGMFIAERLVAAQGGCLSVADEPPTVHVELSIAT